jgi:short-subunit dehydrogenase
MYQNRDLKGKNVVITGGTGSIGSAIGLALIAQGANLCIFSRTPVLSPELLSAGESGGVTLTTYVGDLTCDEEILAFSDYVVEGMNSIDILIHSAGTYYAGSIEGTPVDVLDNLYNVNCRAPYLLTHLLLPPLKRSAGQVVFINSSVRGKANLSQYAASKYSLKALADSLRQEVNADGMRVLSIFAGRTASPMQESVHALEKLLYDPQQLIQPEDIAEIVVNALELPFTAETTDIHIRPHRKKFAGQRAATDGQ